MEQLNYFNGLDNQTRDECALKYRELLLLKQEGYEIPWEDINGKIVQRWSNSALDYIKRNAWCQKAQWGMIWTVRKSDVFWQISSESIRHYWSSSPCIGFSTLKEAQDRQNKLNMIVIDRIRTAYKIGNVIPVNFPPGTFEKVLSLDFAPFSKIPYSQFSVTVVACDKDGNVKPYAEPRDHCSVPK